MGVCCVIIHLKDSTIDEIAAAPRKIFHFYQPDDMPIPKKRGIFEKWLGFKPVVYPLCSAARQPNDSFELGKSWDGVDFLISNRRTDGGIARLLTMKGITINQDIGYGKPQAFYSDTVGEFSRLLQSLTREDFRIRYDARKMRKLYLGLFWSRSNGEGFNYILESFEELKEFIRETAHLKQGVIVIYS